MTLTRRVGYGSTLGTDFAGGTNYVALGNIIDGWSGPGATADEIETTVLVDTYKTFCAGQIDPGECTFRIAFDPTDTDSSSIANALEDGTTLNWQITYASCGGSSTTDSFSAWVKGFSIVVQKDQLTTADITLRITGSPTIAGMSGATST